MAHSLNVRDAYSLINAIAGEAIGSNATIQARDTSSFISVGQTLLEAGTEATLNALGLVLGRTFIAVRPYQAKFAIINAINSGVYANRFRKISYYHKNALPTGADNTNLATNFSPGFDNGTNSGSSVPSQWEQHPQQPMQLCFGGSSEWQYALTVFEHQLKVAFRSEADFIEFMNGIMVAVANDLEVEREAYARATVLNYIGGLFHFESAGQTAVDMRVAYNTFYGTSYTAQQLLTTYLDSFLAFFVATVKMYSDQMENYDTLHHVFPAGPNGEVILRTTPKSRQKMLMLSKFWRIAEATVMPQIFNTEYLDINNFEKVLYWQNVNEPEKVSITAAIPDESDWTSVQTSTDAITISYVLGILFDEDALMVDFQMDDVYSTSIEARKRYRNLWYTIRKSGINDFTEKGILFYMGGSEEEGCE